LRFRERVAVVIVDDPERVDLTERVVGSLYARAARASSAR
jgi:hypothetical protein